MAKKKSGGGGLILWGLITLFIFPPLGVFLLILGIILALVNSTSNKPEIKTIKKEISHEYSPPIQVFVEKIPLEEPPEVKETDKQEKIPPYEGKTSEEEYTYTTAHTQQAVKDKRHRTFKGKLMLSTRDIGDAIGLIRLANKLAGIESISLKLKVNPYAKIKNIVADENGMLSVKTRSPRQAIYILRQAYAFHGLKSIDLALKLKHKKGDKVQILLDIAKGHYKAQTPGGDKDVLAV